MSSHKDKAAEHAEHAGSALAAAERAGEERVKTMGMPDDYPALTVEEQLTKAQVEATLSVAQRLAALQLTYENNTAG